MAEIETLPATWWGDFNFNNDQCKRWCIGPLTLIVRSLSGEWQVGYARKNDFDDNGINWEISDTDQRPDCLDSNSRYVFRNTSGLMTVAPRLADRPVISRPITPFNLTAGEEVTLYVSSPLWFELTTGTSPKRILEEIAIQRPSDTWFGPSTLEGDLCYASTTNCRLSLEDLPKRPHRAITPVFIRNQADSTLLVERLNLPVPLLPLYESSDGQLWTSKVTLCRDKDGDMAELSIDNKPPLEASQATQLNAPRKTSENSALFRAFNAVFS